MKIAILGAGNVGTALGKKFAAAGHEIFYGVRNPSEFEGKDLGGAVGTNREAAAEADAVLLAVPFQAVEAALAACGEIGGKIVIDATNPLAMTEKGLALTHGFEISGAEVNARFAPDVRFVKCFNQTGFNIMDDPQGAAMFVCGDDAQANETVVRLAGEIGFAAFDIGALTGARLLEPLAMLWIHLAYTTELKRDFAFVIQRR